MPNRKRGARECVGTAEWDDLWESTVPLEGAGAAVKPRILRLRDGEWPAERLKVPADLGYGTIVRRHIQSMATDQCMSAADTADLVLAASEAFNNAVRHGTSGAEDPIELSLEITGEQAIIELRYLGQPFAVAAPELPPPTSPNGRGRYIMSMLLDAVEYHFEEPWTTVRLVKNYRMHPAPQTGRSVEC